MCLFTVFFHADLLGNRSDKVYSVRKSIRSYFKRVCTISGINPFKMFVRFHLHRISLIRKILRHGTPWLMNISRPRKYNLRLSTSASIGNKPNSPRAADPDIPGNNPCVMQDRNVLHFFQLEYVLAIQLPELTAVQHLWDTNPLP